MISAALATVILCSLILRVRDKALFLKWLHENNYRNPQHVLVLATTADVFSASVILGGAASKYANLINLFYSLLAALIALIVKFKHKNRCPCFGRASYYGEIQPIWIFAAFTIITALACLPLTVNFALLTHELMPIILFCSLSSFFLFGLRAGKTFQYSSGKIGRGVNIVEREYVEAGNEKLLLLYISRGCQACRQAFKSMRRITRETSIHRNLLVVMDDSHVEDGSTIDQIKIISKNKAPIIRSLKIENMPALVQIDGNGSYEIYMGKPAVVWGLVQHVGE